MPIDALELARSHAFGRTVFGAGLLLAPGLVGALWVGAPADRPGGQVLAMAMGARDLALGLGTYAALRGRGAARPWIRAGIVADAADLVATVRHRDDLPGASVPLVAAMAASSVALGAWLQATLD